MISMAPDVADAVARHTAIAAFPLGQTIGGMWYGMFGVGASPWLMSVTIAGLVMIGSVVAAFAGDVDNIIGVLITRDILAPALMNGAFDLRALLREAPTVRNGQSALEVVDRLRTSPAHMVPVYDEYGHFDGIITPMDVLAAIAGEFPDSATDEPKVVTRPAAACGVVSGSPKSAVIHQPLPCRSNGISNCPSSVTSPRYGSCALRPRPRSGMLADRSTVLKSSARTGAVVAPILRLAHRPECRIGAIGALLAHAALLSGCACVMV
jgi:hypothetical protein